jgi:hypothetical protein
MQGGGMMKIHKNLSLFAFSFFLFCYSAHAQAIINTLGPAGAHMQDFLALGTMLGTNTGSEMLLDDNVIPGVYLGVPGPDNVFNDDGTDGTSNFQEYKNYGSNGDVDRALGSLAGTGPGPGDVGDRFYGIRIRNGTGSAITSVEVRYVGEQWFAAPGVSSAQTIAFAYRVSAGSITDLTTGTYTANTSLNFATPNTSGVGGINGNAAGNRVARAVGFAVSIPINGEIMLRWTDVADAGANHGTGIDDVVVIFRTGTTAADATISGRVVTANGSSMSGARVVLTGGDLSEPVYALTNVFGYFTFTGIQSGHVYAVTVSSKRYRFANPTRTVNLSDSVADVDFVADP